MIALLYISTFEIKLHNGRLLNGIRIAQNESLNMSSSESSYIVYQPFEGVKVFSTSKTYQICW